MSVDVKEIAGLTWEDRELIQNLRDDEWLRPMDLGGRDGSGHCGRLQKLIRKGLARRVRRDSIANDMRSRRGSYVYQRTPEGSLLAARLLATEPTA